MPADRPSFPEPMTHRIAAAEAARCLLCHDAPCSAACPAGTDPAKFIRSLRFRNPKGGAETIREANVFGACCALVCPYDRLCEGACVRCGIDRPIEIGRLQAYLTEQESLFGMEILKAPPADKEKVACIGAGPASLACAAALRMKGYDVTVFEAREKAGGMLTHAIPEFRLPQKTVDAEIERIEKLGVKIVLNTPFGRDFPAKELKRQGFKAVFLGVGLQASRKINLPGSDLDGVIDALPFLEAAKKGRKVVEPQDSVVVVGGGDVAMDCAAAAKLSGAASVTVVYRRTLADAPADRREIAFAQSLGVAFMYGFSPKKVVGRNGKAFLFRARSTDELSEIELRANRVILAVGQDFKKPNAGCALLPDGKGRIHTVDSMTSKEGYFAGGDVVNGGSTVVQAVADGKAAAERIALYLENRPK